MEVGAFLTRSATQKNVTKTCAHLVIHQMYQMAITVIGTVIVNQSDAINGGSVKRS